MKSAIVAVCLFAAVVAGTLFCMDFLEKTSTDMSETIEGIARNVSGESWDEAQRQMEKLEKQWQDSEIYLHAIIDHSEIDTIADSMASIKQYLYYREAPELMAQLSSLKWFVIHIPRKERIAAENIF